VEVFFDSLLPSYQDSYQHTLGTVLPGYVSDFFLISNPLNSCLRIS
jgi:hypothetical protein